MTQEKFEKMFTDAFKKSSLSKCNYKSSDVEDFEKRLKESLDNGKMKRRIGAAIFFVGMLVFVVTILVFMYSTNTYLGLIFTGGVWAIIGELIYLSGKQD